MKSLDLEDVALDLFFHTKTRLFGYITAQSRHTLHTSLYGLAQFCAALYGLVLKASRRPNLLASTYIVSANLRGST